MCEYSGQGSVYEDPKTGEDVVVYQAAKKKWVAESNRFDTEEASKARIMRKIKFWGYTKFVGYADL